MVSARCAESEVHGIGLLEKLYHGVADDREKLARYSLIGVTLVGEFLTCGIGVSLLEMRDPQKARRRVLVAV